MNDPAPTVLGILLGIVMLSIWIVWRYSPRPKPRPRPQPAPRWAVRCDQCGDLEPTVATKDDALDVVLLHMDLNAGHILTLGKQTTIQGAS